MNQVIISRTEIPTLEPEQWLDTCMLDLAIFKSKYAEAVRFGLLTEHDVWRRFLVVDNFTR